jgi:hypothetical protein
MDARKSETTAYNLAATLGCLALNPDIQDEIVEQILSVVGYDRDPVGVVREPHHIELTSSQTFEDYGQLDKVLSAFSEALRLFRRPSLVLTVWQGSNIRW